MPQPFKRNADTPATTDRADSPSAPSKRRRVSRACDACRSAKDKCDGVKPRCQRCISLGRQCTYSHPEKRRGIRTGYLRAIELALAYLLDNIPACESVLLMALNGHEEGQRRVFVDRDSPSAEALLKRWQKSDVYQGIDRLISGEDTTPRADAGDTDAVVSIPRPLDTPGMGTEPSGEMSTWRQPHIRQHQQLQQQQHHNTYHNSEVLQKPPPDLPPNFRHYLDVYLTYTHCWFPIVERESLMRVASSYPHTDFGLDSRNPAYATPSELWSVLAVGAALDSQGPSMGTTATGSQEPPTTVYVTARQLIPSEDGVLGESHVRSLLLLSLAKLSQSELNTAWLLIGQAVRLQLQLPRLADAPHRSDTVASMGCFILDTLISLHLGRPPQTRHCDFPDPSQVRLAEYNDPWNTRSSQSTNYSDPPSSLASLVQQYKFARVLSQHVASQTTTGGPTLPGSGPVDLVQALDPPFHFCNALVHGGLTPRAPGAFLAHAGFLSSSILLSLASLPRVASSLLDVVGHCVSTLGAYGLSPLFVIYLELTVGEGRVEYLKADERERMAELIQTLKHRSGTRMDQSSHLSPVDHFGSADPLNRLSIEDQRPEQRTSYQLGTESRMANFHTLSNTLENTSTYFTSPPANIPQQHVPPNNTAMHTMLSGSLGSESSIMNMGRQEDFPLDYDAILDELSSLDYVDNGEPDPQFMANLGFAPGCELNEMFMGHLGSL